MVENIAQGRVLCERDGVGWTGLKAQQAAVGAVHVGAAERHNAPGQSTEGAHQGERVLLRVGDHVQHNVRREASENICESGQVVTITVDVTNIGRKVCLRFAAMKEGHLVVASADQMSYHVGADEARAADDQYAHSQLIGKFAYQACDPGQMVIVMLCDEEGEVKHAHRLLEARVHGASENERLVVMVQAVHELRSLGAKRSEAVLNRVRVVIGLVRLTVFKV